jgi:hypothetical protein
MRNDCLQAVSALSSIVGIRDQKKGEGEIFMTSSLIRNLLLRADRTQRCAGKMLLSRGADFQICWLTIGHASLKRLNVLERAAV